MPDAPTAESLSGFILSQNYHQGRSGIDLEFWLSTPKGPLRYRVTGQEWVFFVTEKDLETIDTLLKDLSGWRHDVLELTNVDHQTVAALYFTDVRSQREAISRLYLNEIAVFEDDIRPPERFLMERFIQGSAVAAGTVVQRQGYLELTNGQLRPSDYVPSLSCLSLDIETAMRGLELFSIGLSFESASLDIGEQGKRTDIVLMRGDGKDTELIRYVDTERQLLEALMRYTKQWDPDLLVGWSVVNFDFNFLQRKAEQLGMPLKLGRADSRLHLRDHNNMTFAGLPGRAIIDGIDCLKGATYHFDSYSLENVSRQLLDRGKAIDKVATRGDEITRLFHEDKMALATYNIEDCRLVLDIFHHAGLFHYLISRTQMTGLQIDKIGGSSQAFDNLYLPRLHRQGYVAPVYASGASGLDNPGGYVMDSLPGLYDHVLVLDFKSLYPSIILTFQIDPLGLYEGLRATNEDTIPGFNQAFFHREKHILPDLLQELWRQRDTAKAAGNKSLQQAIKIIMNSFYGVLGSPVCRFFDQRLSGSITLRGHQILKETRDFIEAKGFSVIYGDTDSVFVWAENARSDQAAEKIGNELASQLNEWWTQRVRDEFGLKSHLEIEYETHYQRFLMPTIRGSEKGSKKRYAGLIVGQEGAAEIIFKGLESVRSDWTHLAKNFQQELYQRVFHKLDFIGYIHQLVADLYAGELDELLVYQKRLRQPLEGYVKTQPPHVKAAKMAERYRKNQGGIAYRAGESIAYLITTHGPEPVEYLTSPIDYDHYLDRQIRPIAEGILPFVGMNFEALISRQTTLF